MICYSLMTDKYTLLYIMKTKFLYPLIVAASLLLTSCGASKNMRNEFLAIRTDLGYDMTSPEYIGNKKDTLYLDFISYSNMDYYSSVKGRTSLLIPLFVYNFEGWRFNSRLGEGSLNVTYREFLTEALAAEMNSGQPFVMANAGDSVPADKYRMTVTVENNVTTNTMKRGKHYFWFYYDVIDLSHGKVGAARTELTLHVTVKRGNNTLLDKDYSTVSSYGKSVKNDGDYYTMSDECVNSMAESLSQATRTLAEEITSEVSMAITVDKEKATYIH